MHAALLAAALMVSSARPDCSAWSIEFSSGVEGIYFRTQVCSWSSTGRKVWIQFVNRTVRTITFSYKGVIGHRSACDASDPNWISATTLSPGETSEPDFTIDDPTTSANVRVCLSDVTAS